MMAVPLPAMLHPHTLLGYVLVSLAMGLLIMYFGALRQRENDLETGRLGVERGARAIAIPADPESAYLGTVIDPLLGNNPTDRPLAFKTRLEIFGKSA